MATEENRQCDTAVKRHRVIAYIDGFNLYQGMRQGRLRHLYWLDVQSLAEKLLKSNQDLVSVRYFSAGVVGDAAKGRRQATYLDAIRVRPLVTVKLGTFQSEQIRCSKCHLNWTIPKEKQTDVAIATAMLLDAHMQICDVALLISGDSDLVPPIQAIRDHFQQIRVIVAFPPNRNTRQLQQVAHGHYFINHADLAASQLAEEITKPNGHVLKRPEKWTS
jgi:uncharacterized LabA/DUF88 family protein